jgi:hypothetical protein
VAHLAQAERGGYITHTQRLQRIEFDVVRSPDNPSECCTYPMAGVAILLLFRKTLAQLKPYTIPHILLIATPPAPSF